LQELKRVGCAVSRGEREIGVTSIAASTSIFSVQRRAVAALSISGPSDRFKEEDIPDRVKMVQHYAQKISSAFGY
jgi:DNA-binding IclR family transcriptional regulator